LKYGVPGLRRDRKSGERASAGKVEKRRILEYEVSKASPVGRSRWKSVAARVGVSLLVVAGAIGVGTTPKTWPKIWPKISPEIRKQRIPSAFREDLSRERFDLAFQKLVGFSLLPEKPKSRKLLEFNLFPDRAKSKKLLEFKLFPEEPANPELRVLCGDFWRRVASASRAPEKFRAPTGEKAYYLHEYLLQSLSDLAQEKRKNPDAASDIRVSNLLPTVDSIFSSHSPSLCEAYWKCLVLAKNDTELRKRTAALVVALPKEKWQCVPDFVKAIYLTALERNEDVLAVVKKIPLSRRNPFEADMMAAYEIRSLYMMGRTSEALSLADKYLREGIITNKDRKNWVVRLVEMKKSPGTDKAKDQ
jgi:hypothetical protein